MADGKGTDQSSRTDQSGEVPDPQIDVVAYLQHVQGRIQSLTRSAARLPGASDLSFHRSLDRSLAKNLDVTQEDLLDVINGLVRYLDEGSVNSNQNDRQNLQIDDILDAAKFERSMGDIIDTLLEQTDTRLDEYTGKATVRDQPRSRTTRPNTSAQLGALGPLPPHILNAPIKPLPQERFSRKPDNSRERHWSHSLTTKPHANVSDKLAESQESIAGPSYVRRGMYCAEGDPRSNPYFDEIQHFTPPEHALQVPRMDNLQPPPPLTMDEADRGAIPFTWVDDQASFDTLYTHLQEDKVKEVAIDVEHHNFRSYQGLVCLVQVSTRWHDFIIDALSPSIRDMSHKLNEVFANPEKVKILHGAEHDVLWLQRDLNLYLVGLFDTFHATNVLHFSQHSLAFLLQRYIDFVADKRYQLADWRIRPLPKEMLFYARSDTHSLLHIYDCMRFEIGQATGAAGIETVFQESKRTAAKTYAKEVWDDGLESREGWRTMWKKLGGEEAFTTDARFDKGGVDALTLTERLFRALHDWRDCVAREEDESPRYILNSGNLLNLSSRAPQTREGVQACVGSALKKRVAGLQKLIVKETAAFEKVQEEKAARQKDLLERAAAGLLNDEELGEVVDRSDVTVNLWPSTESSTQNEAEHLPADFRFSHLAPLLFATSPADGEALTHAPKSETVSLFAPVSKAKTTERLVKSIRMDLADALGSILASRGDSNSSSLSVYEQETSQQQIASTSPPPMASSPVDQIVTMEIDTPIAQSEQPKEDALTDGIVRIRRAKNNKKGQQSANTTAIDDSTFSEAGAVAEPEDGSKRIGKKRKWTKEEKAERKRLESERLASVKPFDYSSTSSVLDAPAPPPTSTDTTVATGKDGKAKHSSKEASKKRDSKHEKLNATVNASSQKPGRYANVPVGRDRREQAGGKSMMFSH